MSDPRGKKSRMAAQLSFDEAPRRGPALRVLPDAARVEDELVRAAARAGLVSGRHACSVADLERAVIQHAQTAGDCPPLAPPHAVRLAVREAAREATPAGGPFWRIRLRAGYAAAVEELFAVLTQGLLPPGELLRLPEPAASSPRLRALGPVIAAVRGRLDHSGVVEPARALWLAVEALERGAVLPPLLADRGRLEFDGILDWTPLRLRLAVALARSIPVRITLPWAGGRPDLTEALEPVLRALERLGDGPAPELQLVEPEAGRNAGWLRGLFAEQPAEAPAGPVELVSCASPSGQAREVAAAVSDLLEGGAPPGSIAIAARSLEGAVVDELAAALDRFGIPWRERRGKQALESPLVRLALSVLELEDRHFPLAALEELFSSRLVWLRAEGETLPAHRLLRWLREAGIRDDEGGAERGAIDERLAALESRLRLRAQTKGHDPARDLAQVAEVRARASRLLAEVRALPAVGTLREHAAALWKLLLGWDVPGRARALEPAGDGALSRAAAAAAGRDSAAVRALQDLCRDLVRAASTLSLGSRRLTRAEFRELLSSALTDATLPGGGARGAAVQLVELRELPGRSFAHVLLVGLNDGELPARPAPDPLLPDEDRRAVNRAAGRPVFRAQIASGEADLLPSRQAEEPLSFYLALCSARESLRVFWSRADGRGREALPSPFVDELLRALGPGSAPRHAPLLPIPSAQDCRTGGELLARAALELFAEPAWRVNPPEVDAEGALGLAAAVPGPLLRRVAHAALAERERILAFVGERSPGRFSGQLGRAALPWADSAFRFGADAPASARQLEEYAVCGFRTLGRTLLGIDVDDPIGDDLPARDRGTVLHRCLERFFTELQARGLLLTGSPDELALLRRVAAEELTAWAAAHPVGHARLWELRREELTRQLEAVVVAEAAEGAPAVHLEQRFGFLDEGSWPPLRIPGDGTPDVFVRGVIDRVDLEGGVARVHDYKSGGVLGLRTRVNAAARLEAELQLPLYAAAVREHRGCRADAGYVSLRSAQRTQPLSEAARRAGGDLDALLELDPERRALLRARQPPPKNLADELHAEVARLRRGTFEVKPLHCDYCALEPACRLVALPTDPDEGEVKRG